MQISRQFKASDGKIIEVEVNRSKGNQNAVLIVYGLCGDIDQSMFYNAAMTFPKKGYDVWRIRLYGWHKGARTMLNISWKQMMGDIQTVLDKMAKEYKSVSIIGHSMGGTQVVYTDHKKLSCKILWDPSYTKDQSTFNKHKKYFGGKTLHPKYSTVNWGAIVVIQKNFLDEFCKKRWYEKNLKILPGRQPPLLVLRSLDVYVAGWPQEILPAKYIMIPHSDHCFTKADNQKQLFAQTLKFLKAHTQGK